MGTPRRSTIAATANRGAAVHLADGETMCAATLQWFAARVWACDAETDDGLREAALEASAAIDGEPGAERAQGFLREVAEAVGAGALSPPVAAG